MTNDKSYEVDERKVVEYFDGETLKADWRRKVSEVKGQSALVVMVPSKGVSMNCGGGTEW